MPTLSDMLNPRCPAHPDYLAEPHGRCCICEMTTHKHLNTRETPQERDARMAAFHQRFPSLAVAALRVPEPGYRTEADAYGEGIEDDD